MYILRDFQEEACQAVKDALDEGIQRQKIVLPTGSGKAVLIAQIPKINPGQTFVLAHREELLTQAADKIAKANPELSIYIEQGDNYAPPSADIIVASVPTLGRRESKRIERFWQPTNIIVDESHHAVADSYLRIFENFGWRCGHRSERRDPKGGLLIGFTATPRRTDKIGLDIVFDKVVYYKSLRWMIENGYLVDIYCDRILTNTSLDDVKVVRGEFAEKQLSKTVNTDERNSLIVNSYLRYVNGKKTIMFCVDVAHVHSLTNLFGRSGVQAEAIVGSTPREHRKAILDRFARGETKVLVGCMVFTEGFDSPDTEVIGMARPTKSETMFIQMLGRGSRVACSLDNLNKEERLEAIAMSMKPRMTLLDFVDNSLNNSPVMLPLLFGLHKNINMRGKTVMETVKALEKIKGDIPELDIGQVQDVEQLAKIDTKALRTNIWQSHSTPDEVKKISKIAWQKHSDDSYWLSLSKHDLVTIRPLEKGGYEAAMIRTASVVNGKVEMHEPKEKALGTEPTLNELIVRADRWVMGNYPKQAPLLKSDANWRNDTASEKQIKRLKAFKFFITTGKEDRKNYIIVRNEKRLLTKGLASDLLSEKFNKMDRYKTKKVEA